jgi:hypothetical protein
MTMKKKSAKKKPSQSKAVARKGKPRTRPDKLSKVVQPENVKLDEPPSKNTLAKTPRPTIKREEVYENAVKIYMNNRNVAIIKNDNGTLTIVTKRVLADSDSIATFNPTTIEVFSKGKVKVGVLKLRISMDALSAIMIAFTKMLKEGMLTETKVA